MLSEKHGVTHTLLRNQNSLVMFTLVIRESMCCVHYAVQAPLNETIPLFPKVMPIKTSRFGRGGVCAQM